MNSISFKSPSLTPTQRREIFEKEIADQPAAKQDLMRLLNYVGYDEPYEIKVPGDGIDAQKHLNNMRAQLSKWRQEIRLKKIKLQQFKILLVSMTETDVPPTSMLDKGKRTLLVLMKTKSANNRITEDVNRVFGSLALSEDKDG